MSPFRTSLFAALFSVVATAGALYYFQQGRSRELRQLQRQNNQMRAEANRRYLATLGEADRSPPVFSRATTTGKAAPTQAAAATSAPPRAEYYRDEGNATPDAALQTFAWACDRGDTDAVARLLHIDAGARPKAEEFFASLPPAARTQWKNVDAMAATILTRSFMSAPFPNADILETATVETISTDRVRLRLPDVSIDGTEYQKTQHGWSYVLTEAVVDSYIERMKERSRQPER
jgi:hypothetical protein